MIAKLKGMVDSLGDSWLVVDVQGVGYLVSASRKTLGQCSIGEGISLHVETVMKAEQLTLYGFSTIEEKSYFTLLTTVQGVGGRMALAILSVAEPNALTQAILSQDQTFLTQADGVGPKLANRIVRELKDKVAKLDLGPLAVNTTSEDASSEALSALLNLGYRRPEALKAISEATAEGAASLEATISQALKKLSMGGSNG